MTLLALHVLKDPLPALLRTCWAAPALLRWHEAPRSAVLHQQHAAEGGASDTQQANLCSGQQLAILGQCPRLHRLSMSWEQKDGRHYGTASKAPRVLPADARSNQYNRSALLQAVARIAQEVGPASFGPDNSPLVGVARPTGVSADVYAGNLLIGPRSNVHHYWLQPLTYVEAAVAYDLGRSAVFGPQYTVNFRPDAYNSRDRDLMLQDLLQWRPGVFAAAMQSAAALPPLTYDCLEARLLADQAVTSQAESLALSAESLANTHFSGVTRLGNGSYRAAVYEWVKQGDVGTRAANSTRSNRKKVYHYRTTEAKLAAAVAADAMKQALGRPAENFPADVVASALPAMKRWMNLDRLRLTVEQDAWAAKAKAAMLEPASHESEAVAGLSIGGMQQPEYGNTNNTSNKKGAISRQHSIDSDSCRSHRRRRKRQTQ